MTAFAVAAVMLIRKRCTLCLKWRKNFAHIVYSFIVSHMNRLLSDAVTLFILPIA